MKKTVSILLTLVLLLSALHAFAEDAALVPYDYDSITVGNPTPLNGYFFTTLWGNGTSDADVRHLVTDYDLVLWDSSLSVFRVNHSVVSGTVISDDQAGNRSYMLSLYDDLYFSDGTPVTAWDYAFSLLLQCDPVIRELDGNPLNCDYLAGYEEYVSGAAPCLAGLRVMSDRQLTFTVKKEALPYFYELSRLSVIPYPIRTIAPGYAVHDDGNGVYLGEENAAERKALSAELLGKTILDAQTGYRAHPDPGTGPYRIVSFDGQTAKFEINPYYKGQEDGTKPRIHELTYTYADNQTMIEDLKAGKFTLINKATWQSSIADGLQLCAEQNQYTRSSYPRIGLTYVYFNPDSAAVQEQSVRQAIACCFDKPQFVWAYAAQFGLEMEGLFGLGQWMYHAASGSMEAPFKLQANATKQQEAAYDKAVAAWESVSTDALAKYEMDTARAVSLLEDAGWALNEYGATFDPARDAVRCKRVNGQVVKLSLTMAYPAQSDVAELFNACFVQHLQAAGIEMKLTPVGVNDLVTGQNGYADEAFDLIYLGDNFNITFDPSAFFSNKAGGESEDAASSLAAAYRELSGLSSDMMRTEPRDLLGYLQKWLSFQVRFTELLPMIPVYSNMYFDFYTRELHNYEVGYYPSWAKAIVPARMYSMAADETADVTLDITDSTTALDILSFFGNQARASTADYSDGALSAFPEEVRSQIPARYRTINEFVASRLDTGSEDFTAFTAKFTFQTLYPAGDTVYLLFGLKTDGIVDWTVCRGVAAEDGGVNVELPHDLIEKLNGKSFALAAVSAE